MRLTNHVIGRTGILPFSVVFLDNMIASLEDDHNVAPSSCLRRFGESAGITHILIVQNVGGD